MPCHCPTCTCADPDDKYDPDQDYLAHDAFETPDLPEGVQYHISETTPEVNESVEDLLNQLAFLKQQGDANMVEDIAGVLDAAVKYDCYLVMLWLGGHDDYGTRRDAQREYLEFMFKGPAHSFTGDALDGHGTLRYELGHAKTHSGESVAPGEDFHLVIEG